MRKLCLALRLIGLVLFFNVLFCCSALKKTTRVKTQASLAAEKQTELQQLKLKTAVKETNVVTFNPDGTIYQQANIKEQVDQAKLGRLKVEEQVTAKAVQVEKVAKPESFWIAVIAGMIVTALLFYLFKLRQWL